MSALPNIRSIRLAYDEGRVLDGSSFRKVPSASQASTAGWWVDLSMMTGSPLPNYYVGSPLAATTLDPLRGLHHGADKSPASKYLTELCLISPSAAFVGAFRLLDYALFYPFVDLDDLDTQTMDNTVSLPRYTNGEGVRAMLVATTPTVGGGTFTFDYVNQDGDTRTAPAQSCSTAIANIGSVVTSQPAVATTGHPFLLLASGDTGIRSLVSWTNVVSNGGLGAVVLVKPITQPIPLLEVNVPVERCYPQDSPNLPLIPDGAYLNWIVRCGASVASSTVSGYLEFVWSA
jgi:hypothetical protein